MVEKYMNGWNVMMMINVTPVSAEWHMCFEQKKWLQTYAQASSKLCMKKGSKRDNETFTM